MKGIKNIIFDLGGVILNIDYQKPLLAFAALGLQDAEILYTQHAQTELFDKLETGKITGDEFIRELRAKMPPTVTEQQVTDAWNSILLDFPLRRLQILQQLQLHYNIFLLSNTNEIHEAAFNAMLQQQCGYPSLSLFFDKVYYSHRIGLRKPDPAIFTLVLQNHALQANETLFIDDSIQHIEAAKLLGLQTIHVTGGITIENDIFKPVN